jgi:hypothetical protein
MWMLNAVQESFCQLLRAWVTNPAWQLAAPSPLPALLANPALQVCGYLRPFPQTQLLDQLHQHGILLQSAAQHSMQHACI